MQGGGAIVLLCMSQSRKNPRTCAAYSTMRTVQIPPTSHCVKVSHQYNKTDLMHLLTSVWTHNLDVS